VGGVLTQALDNHRHIVQSVNALGWSRTQLPARLSPPAPAGLSKTLQYLDLPCKSEGGSLSVEVESHRELRVLEAISANERTTQRGLAAPLGIALGLANLYLKRLVRKGYIRCVTVPSNRVLYLITPQGIAEKPRL